MKLARGRSPVPSRVQLSLEFILLAVEPVTGFEQERNQQPTGETDILGIQAWSPYGTITLPANQCVLKKFIHSTQID